MSFSRKMQTVLAHLNQIQQQSEKPVANDSVLVAVASVADVAVAAERPIDSEPIVVTGSNDLRRETPEVANWRTKSLQANNTQNPPHEGDPADNVYIADRCAYSKSEKIPFDLIRQIFKGGGLLLMDDSQLIDLQIPPDYLPALREHQPAIQNALKLIYGIAPQISPELIAAIWIYSFRPEVMAAEQNNKWWNVLYLAELSLKDPVAIMRHCTEPPTYLAEMALASKNVASER